VYRGIFNAALTYRFAERANGMAGDQEMAVFRALVAAMAILAGIPAASAGEADVVAVAVRPDGPGTYAFDVTVRHADAGWDHYADRWEVLLPDGRTVLATRTLLHPHEDEQPFTRSLSGVRIPDGVAEVVVRAHDKVHGYGGVEKRVKIAR
jgi:hypothetical protein